MAKTILQIVSTITNPSFTDYLESQVTGSTATSKVSLQNIFTLYQNNMQLTPSQINGTALTLLSTTNNLSQGSNNFYLTNDGGSTDNLTGMPTINAMNAIIATKVNRSGDTMAGFLTANANPVNNLHYATKGYVDNSISSNNFQNVYNNSSPPAFNLSSAGFLIEDPNNHPLFQFLSTDGGTTYSAFLLAQNGVYIGVIPNGGGAQFLGDSIVNYVAVDKGVNNPNFTFTAQSDTIVATSITSGNYQFGFSDESSLPSGFFKLNLIDQGSINNLLYGTGTASGNIPRIGINGQLTVGIPYGSAANSNALVQYNSTTQGIQPITMTTAGMNNIPVTINDIGLTVYVTDLIDGYYYYDGSQWARLQDSGDAGIGLQASYDADNTISLATGRPVSISTQSALANFIYLYSPGAPTPYNYSSLEGMQFTPNVNVYVTALQYVDQYFPSGSRQVAIFRTSDRALMVSDLVYKTDPLDPTNHYRNHAINPVLLVSGISYLIVCIVPANENWTFYSISDPADFNWTGITYGQAATTPVYPTSITNVGAVYGNQNFQYSKANSLITFNDSSNASSFTIASTTQGFSTPIWTSSQESINKTGLSSGNAGLSWFNSTNNINSYWDGLKKQDVLAIGNIIQGSNMTITDNGNGTVTFASTGSGSTTTQVQGSFTVSKSSTFVAPSTSSYTAVAIDGSKFAAINQVGTLVTTASINSVTTPIIQNTSSGGTRYCKVTYDLAIAPSNAAGQTYTFCIAIQRNGGGIVLTNFINTITIPSISTASGFKPMSISGLVDLNTNDYAYLVVLSDTATQPLSMYYFNAELVDTTVASLPSTNALSQGASNIYLSQNGGTTYQYMSGSATVGNIPKFNSTGGQFTDSGISASSVATLASTPTIGNVALFYNTTGAIYDGGFPASQLVTTVSLGNGVLSAALTSLNISGLTASQAVVTNGSKTLASLAYTNSNTASTLVQRDGSGNFSAGTITATLSGNSSTATTATTATNATNVATTQVSSNAAYYPLMAASSTNGNQAADLATGLSYNPSTNILSTTGLNLSGLTASNLVVTNGSNGLASTNTLSSTVLGNITKATRTIISSGSGTYTTPTNATHIVVEVWGSGGGGGGVATAASSGAAAGGGSGGGYSRLQIASPASTYSYSIDSGGAGGAAGNNNGSNGGNTTFGTITVGGGMGGQGTPATIIVLTTVGGARGNTPTGGDINLQGQTGSPGIMLSGSVVISGNGGAGALGTGGPRGLATTSGGGAGGTPGSGGAGASMINGGGAQAGGNGGGGFIIVTEYYNG